MHHKQLDPDLPLTVLRSPNAFGASLFYPLITSSIALLVFLLTLVPEVDWGDSAELSLQAFRLGASHEPGFPLHSISGYLVNTFTSNPFFATNLLSAICTSFTVGLISLIVHTLINDRLASVTVPLIFAFCPIIWDYAITTEVYNVNILFITLSLYFVLMYHRETSRISYLIGSATTFGLSLGVYFPNIILIPFIFPLLFNLKPLKKRILSTITFLVLFGISALIIISCSIWQASVAPIIALRYPPTSIYNTINFFLATGSVAYNVHSLSFYLYRFSAHIFFFVKNFFLIGFLLAIIGFTYHWRTNRTTCISFLAIFCLNWIFFTCVGGGYFRTLVTPSYLIFTLWIAYALNSQISLNNVKIKKIFYASTILLLILMFFTQLPARLDRARVKPVTNFALTSLALFPRNGVVVSRWEVFSVLLYFQKVHHIREDIILIERTGGRQYYEHGVVSGYKNYIKEMLLKRPIIIDHVTPKLRNYNTEFRFKRINKHWYQLELLPT